jgi:hypothetical protein
MRVLSGDGGGIDIDPLTGSLVDRSPSPAELERLAAEREARDRAAGWDRLAFRETAEGIGCELAGEPLLNGDAVEARIGGAEVAGRIEGLPDRPRLVVELVRGQQLRRSGGT